MSVNPYTSNSRVKSLTPWTTRVQLTSTGDCQGLFSLYPSLGNVVYSSDYSIPTALDGPMKVVRYGDLTVNAGCTLTSSLRNKQLVILCDNLTVNGTISMTARGCAVPNIVGIHSFHPLYPTFDLKVPSAVTFTSKRMSYDAALTVLQETGYALWDQGLWATIDPLAAGFYMSLDYTGAYTWMHSNASGYLASDNGAGSIGPAGAAAYSGTSGRNGGCGSGAKGGAYSRDGANYAWRHAKYGSIYGGGSGGGGLSGGNWGAAQIYEGNTATSETYSKEGISAVGFGGGGAGNPGGAAANAGGTALVGADGTGGVLLIICRGVVNIGSTGIIRSNGSAGGNCTGAASCGGGGSGGGAICIMYKTSYTKHASGVVEAVGGAGGTAGTYAGGAGGAGSVQTIPFSTAFL